MKATSRAMLHAKKPTTIGATPSALVTKAGVGGLSLAKRLMKNAIAPAARAMSSFASS